MQKERVKLSKPYLDICGYCEEAAMCLVCPLLPLLLAWFGLLLDLRKMRYVRRISFARRLCRSSIKCQISSCLCAHARRACLNLCSLQAPNAFVTYAQIFSVHHQQKNVQKFVSGTQKRQANYSLNNNKLSSVSSSWGVIIVGNPRVKVWNRQQYNIHSLNLTVGSLYAMQMQMQMQMKMKINV